MILMKGSLASFQQHFSSFQKLLFSFQKCREMISAMVGSLRTRTKCFCLTVVVCMTNGEGK